MKRVSLLCSDSKWCPGMTYHVHAAPPNAAQHRLSHNSLTFHRNAWDKHENKSRRLSQMRKRVLGFQRRWLGTFVLFSTPVDLVPDITFSPSRRIGFSLIVFSMIYASGSTYLLFFRVEAGSTMSTWQCHTRLCLRSLRWTLALHRPFIIKTKCWQLFCAGGIAKIRIYYLTRRTSTQLDDLLILSSVVSNLLSEFNQANLVSACMPFLAPYAVCWAPLPQFCLSSKFITGILCNSLSILNASGCREPANAVWFSRGVRFGDTAPGPKKNETLKGCYGQRQGIHLLHSWNRPQHETIHIKSQCSCLFFMRLRHMEFRYCSAHSEAKALEQMLGLHANYFKRKGTPPIFRIEQHCIDCTIIHLQFNNELFLLLAVDVMCSLHYAQLEKKFAMSWAAWQLHIKGSPTIVKCSHLWRVHGQQSVILPRKCKRPTSFSWHEEICCQVLT